MRIILALIASLTMLLFPAPALAQSLTLTNLKPAVAPLCPGVASTRTIAAFWLELNACTAKPHDHEPPPEKTWVPSPTIEGAADFIAPFDEALGLRKAAALPGVYAEHEGAFRFICAGDGPIARDDPIVYPGQPGASHLHQVWGSLEFNARTNGAKLAAEPRTNCNATPYSLNRSSYWMPAMTFLGGSNAGKVLRPDLISNYYKRGKSTSPQCTPGSGKTMGQCIDLPNELRIVAGWDMRKPEESSTRMSWYCSARGNAHYRDLDALFAAGCPAGAQLIANVILPWCWDGKNLDSPDNRAHMAYPSFGSWGYSRCPSTHPFVIPTTEYKVSWTMRADMTRTVDGAVRSNVGLSSDAMKPGAKPGETMHADYWEKWDARVKARWHGGCIEKGYSCAGGEIGDGWFLIGAGQPSYGWTMPNPVAVPPTGAR